jgi:hypothetical protein
LLLTKEIVDEANTKIESLKMIQNIAFLDGKETIKPRLSL